MSNALPLQKVLAAAATTSRPAAEQIQALSPFMTTLCGIGIVVFLIWLARSVNNPAKVKLSVSPGRSNRLTPIHLIALWVTSILGAVLVLKAIGLYVKLGVIQISIIAGVTAPLLLLVGGLIIASYSFDGGAVRGMGFTRRRWLNDSIRSVIGYLAILPICILLLVVTRELVLQWNPKLVAPHPFLKILMGPEASPFLWAMVILAAGVLAPLGEEVLFRGLLQSMFRRYLRRPWVAIVLTSILFSAAHFDADIKSLPAMFALSLALGYNYERTGRLYSPIMIHMLFNLVNIAEVFTNTAI